MTAYEEACGQFRRLDRLAHLNSMVRWDQMANMPPQGNEARAQALAELEGMQHELATSPALGALLRQASDESLDDVQQANLREMTAAWRVATALPDALVKDRTLAGARCEHAWRSQRPRNDWEGFAANLREVVRLAREQAKCLAAGTDRSPYEALVDLYEPGARCADIDRLFSDLKSWLPALMQEVLLRQREQTVILPQGPFPKAAQRALGLETMDGGHTRDRSWTLRTEPAAGVAGITHRPGTLDGYPREPESFLRNAARPPPRLCPLPTAAARPSPG